MDDAAWVEIFELRRPFLTGLAYRMLGSRADAEDVVQDVFVKWLGTDRYAVDNPAAWLTTVCTRRCLNELESARRARTEYFGMWLPEPVQGSGAQSPEQEAELACSLSTAFLLLLERLAPKERAAYLLHEIFGLGHAEVASAIGVREEACRKLVSRARVNIGRPVARQLVPPHRQQSLLHAFRHAISTGQTDLLSGLLAEDVVLAADGGGKVAAIATPLSGRETVLGFIATSLSAWWRGYAWEETTINGSHGALLRSGGVLEAAVSFSYDSQGCATGIYVVRNPDKLASLSLGGVA